MDLYTLLGINPDATKGELVKAYRHAAKDTHPDREGDRERFEQVKHAYEVLKDDKRRAHYDATGETADPNDKEFEEVIKQLSLCLAAAIGMYADQGVDPSQDDVVDAMQRVFTNQLQEYGKARQAFKKVLAAYRKTEGRFKTAESVNHLAGMVNAHIGTCQRKLAEVEANIKNTKAAIEALRSYRYDYDTGLPASVFADFVMSHP